MVFICEPNGWIRGVVEEALMVIIHANNRRYRRLAIKVAKIRIVPREQN